jgi:hypothetical protein
LIICIIYEYVQFFCWEVRKWTIYARFQSALKNYCVFVDLFTKKSDDSSLPWRLESMSVLHSSLSPALQQMTHHVRLDYTLGFSLMLKQNYSSDTRCKIYFFNIGIVTTTWHKVSQNWYDSSCQLHRQRVCFVLYI